jgi:hypothetical protein
MKIATIVVASAALFAVSATADRASLARNSFILLIFRAFEAS